jgi:hypothetical protein
LRREMSLDSPELLLGDMHIQRYASPFSVNRP